jgi:hypothetical protein
MAGKGTRGRRIFLSYAAADKHLAEKLAEGLSNAGHRVWWDHDIVSAENWAGRVSEALEASDTMVVLVSPESLQSRWVRREIEFALGSPKYSGRLIPVVVRPTNSMPWIFQRLPKVSAARTASETSKRILRALADSSAAA